MDGRLELVMNGDRTVALVGGLRARAKRELAFRALGDESWGDNGEAKYSTAGLLYADVFLRGGHRPSHRDGERHRGQKWDQVPF